MNTMVLRRGNECCWWGKENSSLASYLNSQQAVRVVQFMGSGSTFQNEEEEVVFLNTEEWHNY